jgi:hypothetical protein
MRMARTVTLAIVVAAGVMVLMIVRSAGQSSTTGAGRAADGKASLNGIWQALGTAHWDIEDHEARPGPLYQSGAVGAIPAGRGIVEGGEIPYRPEALAKKKENLANWLDRDPEVKCYLPGVPRATYLPFPFQIVQGTHKIMIVYEYAAANRTIHMDKVAKAPVDTWMGVSNGRWEEETLVVDSIGFNDQTWFDRSGNFHSDDLHVIERFKLRDPDHMQYEATIEDPKTFTRPWKVSLPLYRRVDATAEILEFKCPLFAEELLYGHLRNNPAR